jgi:DNA-binding NtrC family response regulator
MSESARREVLVVDDDAAIRVALSEALTDMGVAVRAAADGSEALAMIAAAAPDLVLTDVRMPGVGGVELLRLLRQRAPDTDVVLMTAHDDMPTIVTAMREGALDFLVKPIRFELLRELTTRVFEDRRARHLQPRGTAQPGSFTTDALVGRDPAMIQVFKLVGQAAAGRVNVLIRGESGTGKELVARAIHASSADSREPFVPVNCAALPTTLLESELFGHTRGAFTGAVGARRGRFALAGRGTIFLDEIGDTSPEFQSKLLRVLQEHEFYAVGADHAERSEARVIAATHRDLEQLVEEGKFRQDLYYRLRVVEVQLPPLRERLGDIPQLARHLVARAARAAGYPEPVLSDAAIDALLRHRWPGNVRELENCLTRGTVLAAGSVIRPEHLVIQNGLNPSAVGGTPPSLDAVEREHLQRVLAHTGGQKNRAAEILGVSRPRLNRLLRRHGLE